MIDEPRIPTEAERAEDAAISAALRRLRAQAPPNLADRVIAAAPVRRRYVFNVRRLAVAASFAVAVGVGYVATRPGAIEEATRGLSGAEVGEGQAALSAATYAGSEPFSKAVDAEGVAGGAAEEPAAPEAVVRSLAPAAAPAPSAASSRGDAPRSTTAPARRRAASTAAAAPAVEARPVRTLAPAAASPAAPAPASPAAPATRSVESKNEVGEVRAYRSGGARTAPVEEDADAEMQLLRSEEEPLGSSAVGADRLSGIAADTSTADTAAAQASDTATSDSPTASR